MSESDEVVPSSSSSSRLSAMASSDSHHGMVSDLQQSQLRKDEEIQRRITEGDFTPFEHVAKLAGCSFDSHHCNKNDQVQSLQQQKRCGPFIFRVLLVEDGCIASSNVDAKTEGISWEQQRSVGSSDDAENDAVQPLRVIVSDGKELCAALILRPTEELLRKRRNQYIVVATGLIVGLWYPHQCSDDTTTTGSRGQQQLLRLPDDDTRQKPLPYLYITRLLSVSEDISNELFSCRQNRRENVYEDGNNILGIFSTSGQKILHPCIFPFQHGNAAEFLASKTLDVEVLTGKETYFVEREDSHRCAGGRDHDNAEVVTDFLEQHGAIIMLKEKSNRQGRQSLLTGHLLSSTSTLDPLQSSVHNYLNSLVEFDCEQREKIVACFKRTVDATDEPKKNQATSQFRETLEYAVTCKDEPLSLEMLVRWHLWLMGDGLHEDAGELRDASDTIAGMKLCDHKEIPRRLEQLFCSLESHWLPQIHSTSAAGRDMATFVAVALLGVWDISPFDQGRPRFWDLFVNWAVRRCGLPFCVHFLDDSTADTLTSKLRQTLQNVFQVPLGDADKTDALQVLNWTSGLDPLVTFFLKHTASAVHGACAAAKDKATCTLEDTNARIVRKAREAAADTRCFVCFEEQPNISTLCCGKPVHFNCLAQWLHSHSSCPQCRSIIPSLQINQSNPFGMPRRIENDDNNSEVERFIGLHLGNASDDSSSNYWPDSLESSSDPSSGSSSNSSSSSSSSSSPSLPHFLSFGHHSSDEEETQVNQNEDDSSTVRYVSESEDWEEHQHFFNANLAPSEDEQDTHTVPDSPLLWPPQNDVEGLGEEFGNENESTVHGSQSVPFESTPFISNHVTPRMSFLDPVLLVNVQRENDSVVYENPSIFVNSSSIGDDNDVNENLNETMFFTRNQAMRIVSPDRIASNEGASRRSPVIYNRRSFGQEDEVHASGGYDHETQDDDAFFVPSEVEGASSEAATFCIAFDCFNQAHAECGNKRCYSCCLKQGADCPIHSVQRFRVPSSGSPIEPS